MNNIIIISIIINVILSGIISSSVKNRQISSSKVFLMSVLFSPIVGMFLAMMSPELKEGESKKMELDLPVYKDEDPLISFFEKNLKYIFVGLFILFLISNFSM